MHLRTHCIGLYIFYRFALNLIIFQLIHVAYKDYNSTSVHIQEFSFLKKKWY
jgi:hypothetical protein